MVLEPVDRTVGGRASRPSSSIGASRCQPPRPVQANTPGARMNADKVIKWFMPKEERFHELLERDTQNLVNGGAGVPRDRERHDLEERKVKAVQLKGIEQEGDGIARQIFEALNTTFITPFDREDIRSLASDLDDILDCWRECRQVPGAVRAGGVAGAAAPLRGDPDRHGRRDRQDTHPDLGHGQPEQDPGIDGADLGARERRRLALLHRDRRAVPQGLHGLDRDPEVEGGLRRPRGRRATSARSSPTSSAT